MKKWNTPAVAELNVAETANGFLDVDWEGPFGVVCGDKSEQKPSTPDTEDDTNIVS